MKIAAQSMPRQLSESQIIDLGNMFVTPGRHYVQVKTIKQGRMLVYSFLNSLNYYKEASCLSLHPVNEPSVLNLYDILTKQRWTDKPDTVNDFFYNHFYSDFLWIEATTKLRSKPWFGAFEEQLDTYFFNTHMPIVILTYDRKQTT